MKNRWRAYICAILFCGLMLTGCPPKDVVPTTKGTEDTRLEDFAVFYTYELWQMSDSKYRLTVYATNQGKTLDYGPTDLFVGVKLTCTADGQEYRINCELSETSDDYRRYGRFGNSVTFSQDYYFMVNENVSAGMYDLSFTFLGETVTFENVVGLNYLILSAQEMEDMLGLEKSEPRVYISELLHLILSSSDDPEQVHSVRILGLSDAQWEKLYSEELEPRGIVVEGEIIFVTKDQLKAISWPDDAPVFLCKGAGPNGFVVDSNKLENCENALVPVLVTLPSSEGLNKLECEAKWQATVEGPFRIDVHPIDSPVYPESY